MLKQSIIHKFLTLFICASALTFIIPYSTSSALIKDTASFEERVFDQYYFISDLHIGGDGYLNTCEFENELIGFLKRIEVTERKTELIMLGDIFGLWELTDSLPETAKLEYIIKSHSNIFEQFKATGQKIQITILPGNHDYPLACSPRFTEILKNYNIDFRPGKKT